MNCNHPDHQTESKSNKSLRAAKIGQVAVVIDGLSHGLGAAYALSNTGNGHNHTSHTHDEHEHTEHGHTHTYTEQPDHAEAHNHSVAADIGWAGLSIVMLGYLLTHHRSDKRRAEKHQRLAKENSKLEELLKENNQPIPDITNGAKATYSPTPSLVALLGAGAQVAHAGAHIAAGGVLMHSAATHGIDEYTGLLALAGATLVAGSLVYHTLAHWGTDKHYRQTVQRNEALKQAQQ